MGAGAATGALATGATAAAGKRDEPGAGCGRGAACFVFDVDDELLACWEQIVDEGVAGRASGGGVCVF